MKMKTSGAGWRGWLDNNVNELSVTELTVHLKTVHCNHNGQFDVIYFCHNKKVRGNKTTSRQGKPRAHRGPGCGLPPAVLDELNVGEAKLAQALLQVLAEAAQGHLGDVDIAEQLPVQRAAETNQPGGHRRAGW